jgi:CheY-like chemotaxis protein
VLGNLLNNASKYSPPESEIAIDVTFADGLVSIAIGDQGAGIAAEFLPHVFDLFSQSARSLDRSEGGLGIGLTLVKSLVELHGGSVTAQSAGVDQGSTFTVRLPAQHARIEAEHAAEAVRTIVRLRVLVVDDNVDSAEMLSLLLDTEGYVVNCCFDGPSALAEMPSGYDAVILDIGLPGMDGFTVAREVRKIYPAGKPILIALTGYGQPSDFARSREAGFDYHLIKPVEPAALCRLLDSIATLEMR